MAKNGSIVFFVEDPGVTACIAPLPAAFATAGWKTVVYAHGLAQKILEQRQIPFLAQAPNQTAKEILQLHDAAAVFVGTAENLENLGLSLVELARELQIPSFGVIDASMYPQYRFCGKTENPRAYAPDYVLVPDEWTKKEYLAIGFLPEKVFAVGNPQYDFVLGKKSEFEKLNLSDLRKKYFPQIKQDQKVIVFVDEGVMRIRLQPKPEMDFSKFTLIGRGAMIGRNEIVLEEFLDAVALLSPKPFVVLRVHPKGEPNDYQDYTKDIDLMNYGGSALELVFAADFVVGSTSMLLLEAAMLGKKCLSIVPEEEEREWLWSVRAGLTPGITTREQLREFLPKWIKGDVPADVPSLTNIVLADSTQRIVELTRSLLESWKKKEIV